MSCRSPGLLSGAALPSARGVLRLELGPWLACEVVVAARVKRGIALEVSGLRSFLPPGSRHLVDRHNAEHLLERPVMRARDASSIGLHTVPKLSGASGTLPAYMRTEEARSPLAFNV
ncbi:hypothetical protein NDU88_006458 [Pleurodeles waltl]|uniref:Uncharacterized protein n=1 Tax=Pleurodeles waltl TaxID=8319 RepID=A0AAV7SPM4_PLEWA|nr:hypothetical protein NDU88_006458 [Pleurodeles waltl]